MRRPPREKDKRLVGRRKVTVSEFEQIKRESLAKLKQVKFTPGTESQLCEVGGHNRSLPSPLYLREFAPNEHVLTIALEAKGVKYVSWTWYNAPLVTVDHTPLEALTRMHRELKRAIDHRKLSEKGGR